MHLFRKKKHLYPVNGGFFLNEDSKRSVWLDYFPSRNGLAGSTTKMFSPRWLYLFNCFALLLSVDLLSSHIAAIKMATSIVNSLLFKPPSNHVEYKFPTRVLSLNTRTGNTISATHIKRRGATVTILYSHGNAEDLNFCFGWMRRMSRALNVNVFAYDYAGYGGSTGESLPCTME